FKSFLNDLVKEGRVKPVDFDNQLAKLEALNKVDPKIVETEKSLMKSFVPVVDLSGKHFANKDTVVKDKSVTAFENAVAKKQSENKNMSYRECVEAVGLEQPELASIEEE
ncbi:MAG: hypothetical protein MIO92_02905, partial [Methanosarcinaceae archaeon]|nr:hypothetical protein [Methanosarcinaceae archaeon]